MCLKKIFYPFLLAVVVIAVSGRGIVSGQESEAVKKFCKEKRHDDLKVSADKFEGYDEVKKNVEAMFPIDGDELSRQFLEDGMSGFYRVMRDQKSTIVGLNYGILIAALALTFIMAPIMICCCCCPHCCTPSKCCSPQKDYTTCELCGPNVSILILSVISIGLTSFILFQSNKISQQYQDFKCATSLVGSNLLYGRENESGNEFFTGLKTLKDQIYSLQQQPAEFNQEIQKLTNQTKFIRNFERAGADLLDQVALIPTGINQDKMVLLYETPLLSSSPSQSMESSFPSVLGTWQDQQKLVGKWYEGVQDLVMEVGRVSELSSSYLENFSGLNDLLKSNNKTSMEENLQNVEYTDFKIAKTFELFDDGLGKIVIIGGYVILGLTILFCLLIFLGACGLICYKYSCRNLIYCSCSILWLLTIFHFLIALFFSISTPIIHYSCGYIVDSMDSPALFSQRLEPVLEDSQVGRILATCMAKNNEDNLLKEFLDEELYLSLSPLSQLIHSLDKLDPLHLSSRFNGSFTSFTETANQYRWAEILDFGSQEQIEELVQISKSSSYPDCSSSTPSFAQDSWIPSKLQTDIPCQVNASSADNCLQDQFTRRGPSCQGCLDSAKILQNYESREDVVIDLSQRYPECREFVSDLGNLWENFYRVKETKIGGVVGRGEEAQSKSREFEQDFTSVANLFKEKLSILSEKQPGIADPKEGVFAGSDCSMIKSNINLSFQIFCNSTLVSSYNLRFLFAGLGFSLMLLLCCGICSGSRHYLQEKMENQSKQSLVKRKAEEDVENLEKQLSEKRFNRYF